MMKPDKVSLSLRALLSLCIFGCLYASPVFGQAFLVKDGQPQADIVIAEAPPRTVKLAAGELQTHIEKISGATLPIATRPSAELPAHIYVGTSAYTEALKITDEGLKYGAFRMTSGKNYLVLLGHDKDYTLPQYTPRAYGDRPRALQEWDARTGEKWGIPIEADWSTYNSATGLWEYDERGSLNAVYEFLRGLGVRWYMPGDLGEIVPQTKTIALPSLDKVVKPDFPFRNLGPAAPLWRNGTRDAILYKLRIGLDPTMGIGGPHGLNNVNGREEVKQAHPEYFALYGDNRATTGDFFATCFSSEGLFESTVKYVRAAFDIYPDMQSISIWPNDGFTNMCQCELCKGKDSPERGWNGFMSNYVWEFADRVAREVYKTHPDRKIICGAYSSYTLPPENIVKFSPNLVVGLVETRMQFVNPEAHARTLKIRQGYLDKVAPGNMYIYSYYLSSLPRYGQSDLPVFFPHIIAEDLRSLKGLSQGEFIELSWGGNDMHAYGFNHLNVYVTARYYWDAGQDVDKMLDEYYTLFYGPAAGEMKTFIEFSEKNWPLMQTKVEPIDQAFELLAAARETAGDTVYGKRIDLLVDYIQPMKQRRDKLAQGRPKGMPLAVAVERNSGDLKLDGQLDEPFWKDAPVYELKDIATGKPPVSRTTFQVAWSDSDRSIIFGVRCEDADMQNLSVGTTRNEDSNIWNGDEIEILLDTQLHSYYQIAINPAAMIDVDHKDRMDTLWSACADSATYRGDTFWSIEIRIPTGDLVEGGLDPLKKVEGKKPVAEASWFFNVCRQRIRDKQAEHSAFSPVGAVDFLSPDKFGELIVK